MTSPTTIVEVPEQQILSIRDRATAPEFPAFVGAAFGELFDHVGRHGITTMGHPFVIYHAFGPDRIDAEVCVPIIGMPPTDDRIRTRDLPAVTVARTLHVGPYEGLSTTYEELTQWVADHGLEVVGPYRERYLTGPSDDLPPSEYRTEVETPVMPVAVAAGR